MPDRLSTQHSTGQASTSLMLSPLYAILDIDSLLRPGAVVFEGSAAPATPSGQPADPDAELLALVLHFASELHAGGVRLLRVRFEAVAGASRARARLRVAAGLSGYAAHHE